MVALSHTLVYSTGVMFEFVALARGLTRSASRLLFHEQHAFDTDELPDGLLRLGVELADGRRVSNIGGLAQRRLMNPEAEPEEPVFLPRGGGGGNAGNDRVSMKPGYWLWPLPPAGHAEALVRVADRRHPAHDSGDRRERDSERSIAGGTALGRPLISRPRRLLIAAARAQRRARPFPSSSPRATASGNRAPYLGV